jgi:hypothetical protein
MPIIVFWLTPVALALVLLLVVLGQGGSRGRKKLFLVEPLLFLVGRYQLARCDGDQKRLLELLSDWLPGLELQQSLLEQIARQIVTTPPLVAPKEVEILSQRALSFWAEERLLRRHGKKYSVLAGPVSEVATYCDADPAGPLTPEKAVAWQAKADTAHRNGFWTLSLAESAAEDALLRKKYRLCGLLILEPVLDDRAVIQLRQAAGQGAVRFLSVAAGEFVATISERIFPSRREKVVSGFELSALSPKEQERSVEAATIYGAVGKNNRYWIARFLQQDYRLAAFSRVPLDDDLPAHDRL